MHGWMVVNKIMIDKIINFDISSIALVFLIVVLSVAAVKDYKTKTISDKLILINLAGGIIFCLLNTDSNFIGIFINTVILFLMLLFIHFITKGQLGMGDVKLITTMGLYFNILTMSIVLFYSTVAAAIVGIGLILLKKADKKTELPFVPFILVGVLLYMIVY